jgi:O-antigen ligase
MVDSPSWMSWAQEVPRPAARPRPAQRVTAAGMLAFAAAVVMVIIYTQCWLMAVQGDKTDATDSSALVRALFFPAYGCSVLLLALSPGEVLKTFLRQPLLILILWVVGASMLWSINPDQTFRRFIALVFTTLGGVILAARWKWAGLAEIMATALTILAAISLFLCLFVPSYGRMHDLFPGAWRGLWIEKNALGNMMTIGFMACAAAALLEPRRARLWWPAAGLCLLLVLASTSKTSLVSCLLGCCGLGLVWVVRRGPAGRVLGTYGALVGLLILGFVGLFASGAVLAALGKDATLTGRTQIWAAVMRRIQDRPWLGYGYGAVWDDTSPWSPLAWIIKQAGFRPFHAHNSWLQQWLDLGVAGLIAWALYFVETCTRAMVALYRSPGAYLAIPFLLVYAMTSLTESIAVTFNDCRWMFFVAIAARLATPDEDAPRRPARRPLPRAPAA